MRYLLRNNPPPNWLPYQQSQFYHHPYSPQIPMMGGAQGMPPPYGYGPNQMNYSYPPVEFNTSYGKQTSHLFQNPLQPDDNYQYEPYLANNSGYPNNYPQSTPMQKPATGQFSSVLNSFKSQDGSFDFNKMINTAGQVVNAINQVSNMAKGIGGIFKT